MVIPLIQCMITESIISVHFGISSLICHMANGIITVVQQSYISIDIAITQSFSSQRLRTYKSYIKSGGDINFTGICK